ncbi:two-component sensor histidine kinase [Paractinoplanes abujensis]|uniref:Signal transduction histidine kinase n=1 Tax=Paractinoplanes abujensis TaxID=882441 RepID=A0A7W7CZY5_9ACTN|nr:sensor histidine kinase [Actinoplanes abujensis]MBB4697772.1 signal transduction histidine kinase [Actinoplanes abujensis]GID19743.1 two-component sensor histidine kinase [Actinoplanes abujensis]
MKTEDQVPYPHLWDLYLAVIAAAAVTVVLVVDRPWPAKLGAAGAIGAMALLHAVFGRDLIRADRTSSRLLAAHLVLFATAVTLVPESNWLLFALIPLMFQLAGLRQATIAVVLANAALPVSDLILRPDTFGLDLVIAAISCATGIWLGFWIIRVIEQSQERHRLIVELENSRAEVARLSREAGVTAERSRLAAEIHDTLAQGFTSIITLLQAADPELKDDKIALAVRTARENLAESRSLVAALSPAPLASISLPSAVRRQVERFAEESGVRAGLRVTGDERDLPTAAEVVLLRAAQEALTNVRRHASAQEAAVLLAYTPAAVRLVVRDDGCGFVPGAADGYGLAGMRARAEQVNGAVTVHSDPDTGTTIEVEVPV